MTKKDIQDAVDKALQEPGIISQLNVTRREKYDLNNRSSNAKKLDFLFRAGKLQLKDGPSK